ncbi:9288_t:CDS:2, partial [Acaulospora colombiana]
PNTRKLVAEVLSFFCYCEIPTGHNLVLGGFDQLMQFQSEHGRFDAWMRTLENTIDGRGRYGSLVNASEEYKKSGIGLDNSLMDDVFQYILSMVKGTRAYDFFLSAMQHMLLIRSNDGDVRTRYFQLIDALVTQVVMDKHGVDQDWNNSLNTTVSQMLSKIADQDKIQAAIDEAKEAKAVAEKALHEKHELQKELASRADETVGELRKKVDSLEELLRISRHTIQTLQQKLADLEASYFEKLTEHNIELRDFERIIKEQQNASDSGSLNRQEIITKLERMQEIAKTEAKLVGGKVWTPTFGDFKVPDASEYIYNSRHNIASQGVIGTQDISDDLPQSGSKILDQPKMNADILNELKSYKRKNGTQIESQHDDGSLDLPGEAHDQELLITTQNKQDQHQSPSSEILPSSEDSTTSDKSRPDEVTPQPSSSLQGTTPPP